MSKIKRSLPEDIDISDVRGDNEPVAPAFVDWVMVDLTNLVTKLEYLAPVIGYENELDAVIARLSGVLVKTRKPF